VKQKLHITFTSLFIAVGVYILFTDYTPQTQGQSIILALSIILLMVVLFLDIKGDRMAEDENIVKATCRELGITQKELAERLGVNDSTVRKWASQAEPPEWGLKFLRLLLEKEKVEKQLSMFKDAFNLIDKARG